MSLSDGLFSLLLFSSQRVAPTIHLVSQAQKQAIVIFLPVSSSQAPMTVDLMGEK